MPSFMLLIALGPLLFLLFSQLHLVATSEASPENTSVSFIDLWPTWNKDLFQKSVILSRAEEDIQ